MWRRLLQRPRIMASYHAQISTDISRACRGHSSTSGNIMTQATRSLMNNVQSHSQPQSQPQVQQRRTMKHCNMGDKRRRYATNTGWKGMYNEQEEEEEITEANIERIPVPSGIATDKMGFYDISDSRRGLDQLQGTDSLFIVHGPSEVWAPKGLVKGHGAGGGLFAVFEKPGGFQFKVREGDVFYTDRIRGEVNSQVMFDDVLLLGSVDWSWFGRPCIKGVSVVTTIEEQTKSAKIYITKFKKRTGYSRRKGHRQDITRFRVNHIQYQLPDASRFSVHVPPCDPHAFQRNFEFEF